MAISFETLKRRLLKRGFTVGPVKKNAEGAIDKLLVLDCHETAARQLRWDLALAGREWDCRAHSDPERKIIYIVDRRAGERAVDVFKDKTGFAAFRFDVETEPGYKKTLWFKDWEECSDAWNELESNFLCGDVDKVVVLPDAGRTWHDRLASAHLHAGRASMRARFDAAREDRIARLRADDNARSLSIAEGERTISQRIYEFDASIDEADDNDCYLFEDYDEAERRWVAYGREGVERSRIRAFQLDAWSPDKPAFKDRRSESVDMHPDPTRLADVHDFEQ